MPSIRTILANLDSAGNAFDLGHTVKHNGQNKHSQTRRNCATDVQTAH
jgi:hypothetical protein